jgi:hypothetical protein
MPAWRTNQIADSRDDSHADNPDDGDCTRAVGVTIGGLEIDRRKGERSSWCLSAGSAPERNYSRSESISTRPRPCCSNHQ